MFSLNSRKSQLDEHTSFLMFTRYEDTSTFNLVGAVSETLGVPVEAVLEIFGEFFFDYCLRHGYDKMLRTLGSDIKSFIQNLDSLHSLLALSYKGISAPSFRCEDGLNGELILHYYSGRPGLYPIVKGVLKAVARDLFDQSVEMTVLEQNKEDIGCNQSQEHTAFRELVEFNPEKILLRATDFCSAFPYHIIFDRDLRIRQCGDLVQKHSNTTVTEGMPLTKAFSIVHPRMVLTIENIRKFINAVFLLAMKPSENGRKTFLLKGQMIWLADTQHMIFIGSPRLTSLNELLEMNVYLADIPLYDVTRELVLLNQQRIAEIDIAKRLDETTAELKRTSQALEQEKCRTETLLHQMLPRKVAIALTNGRKVEAEKFGQVTILFSDIVTFTNIASACSPMDIVSMLNELYQRFDARTSQHNVYKVETIGDAYMIVSGVPEQTRIHAQPVANFALDMVEDAGLVRSPATGLPLQIRVGVHTGPVVAGVVGVKMPRYCLFGDTVNTASRMESHGLPGRIHVSPTTYQALRGWGYAFKHRGEMEVKGKGIMGTYFLCGYLDRRLAEPQDNFTDLDIFQDGTENEDYTVWPRTTSQEKLDKNAEKDQENLCEPSHGGVHSSDTDIEYDERVTFISSTDSDHSPKKAPNVRKHENQTPKLQDNVYNNSSHVPLACSMQQQQSTGQKKSSNSPQQNVCLFQGLSSLASDISSEVHSIRRKSILITKSVSTQTSLLDSRVPEDCLYINGSFKNDFRERIYTGIKDCQPQADSVKESLSHEIPILVTNDTLSDKEKEQTSTQKNGEKRTQLHSENVLCNNVHSQSSVQTVSERGKKGHSMSKDEPFCVSSPKSPLHQVRPSSTSLENLKRFDTDVKNRRAKKHRSKLCNIV
ncbi:unnamed protein product [Candidula unifasciata]|uniref:guanylate cyclase n=1 Tax=Candidula unifasciata TaxID=100452 RepID=A0A8S3YTI1_9EUPU|nr:unnamed protein product [Candidula unifasciata]